MIKTESPCLDRWSRGHLGDSGQHDKAKEPDEAQYWPNQKNSLHKFSSLNQNGLGGLAVHFYCHNFAYVVFLINIDDKREEQFS